MADVEKKLGALWSVYGTVRYPFFFFYDLAMSLTSKTILHSYCYLCVGSMHDSGVVTNSFDGENTAIWSKKTNNKWS